MLNRVRAEPGIASWWQRGVAYLVDLGFLFVASAPLLAAARLHPDGWLYARTVQMLLLVVYAPLMHQRYGQTLGKMLLKLEVRTIAGDRLTPRHAWLRSIMDLVRVPVWLVLLWMAWLAQPITFADHMGIFDMATATVRMPNGAWLHESARWWLWLEFAAMMLNRKRRTVHDFVGGTIVVRRAHRDPDTTSAMNP